MHVFFNRAWSLLISSIPGVLGAIVGTWIKLQGALFSFPFLVKSNSKYHLYIQAANCLDWSADIIFYNSLKKKSYRCISNFAT